MTDDWRRFHGDQVQLAMHSLLQCIKHRSALFVRPAPMADSLEPDIRYMADSLEPDIRYMADSLEPDIRYM